MTVFAPDVSVDADVPEGNDSSALREQAAAENAALEVLHWESLQEEIAIAEDAGSRNNLFAGASAGSGGFASDADFLQVLPISDSAHDVSVIDGYSADNAFSHARSRLESQRIQHFWESGFWNDFFDPSKTFLSSFDSNFKRPVDPVHGDVHEVFEQQVERKPKAAKLHATFIAS